MSDPLCNAEGEGEGATEGEGESEVAPHVCGSAFPLQLCSFASRPPNPCIPTAANPIRRLRSGHVPMARSRCRSPLAPRTRTDRPSAYSVPSRPAA